MTARPAEGSEQLRTPTALRTPQNATTALASKPTCSRLGPLIAGGVIAATITLGVLAAPPANALSEQQIQRNCEAAGGTYNRAPNDSAGNRLSSCCAKTSKGTTRCWDYVNGAYLPSEAPPPTTQPPVDLPPVGPGVLNPGPAAH
jgi:hypothetical protein